MRGYMRLRERARAALRRPEAWALSAIVLAGLALRAYFVARWRPALIGFPDSSVYLVDAQHSVFDNPLRVGGYALFLKLFHAIRAHLSFAISMQHLMGVASGLFMFGAVRRAGAPAALGLVPAAVVILGGSEIFIEHAVLTESAFVFAIALALYALVRAWHGSAAWALPAGLALGMAVIVRSVGLAVAPVAIVVFLVAASTSWRSRLLPTGVLIVATAFPVTWYLVAHKRHTGFGGFTATGYVDLYARVAPFADCRKFTPPKQTRRLCIHIPVSQRQGNNFWEFTGESPAVQMFGPFEFGSRPKRDENALLRKFAVAAILGQPLDYLEFVGRGLVRIVDPSYSASPYGIDAGYGDSPQSLVDSLFDPHWQDLNWRLVASYYPGVGPTYKSVSFLRDYERATRVEGPFMALLLMLALLAPFLARGPPRRGAILLGTVALVLLVAPVAFSQYDYRFVIPALGPLAATSAIGGWALGRRAVSVRGRRAARRAGA